MELSSATCSARIKEFEAIKSNVNNVIQNLDDCDSETRSTSEYIDELIISGERIDSGLLSEFSTSFSNMRRQLQEIITECDGKIEYYNQQYDSALKREKMRKMLFSVFAVSDKKNK